MPTYEYKCSACGHAFERFQSIKADPIRKCPECGKNKVDRLIGVGAGIIFKGTGFYVTDYRDSSYTEKAKAESGESSSSETAAKPEKAAETSATAASSKTESTPAPAKKTESKPSSSSGKSKKK